VSSGDPHLFQQAVLNVVVNAVQAMDRGGTLTVTTGCGRDRHCLVTVADTGPGIPAALQRKVFDPFFTTKPEGEGTGLGLAIAHRILELHGATIRVESEPGRGAAFHIDLPLGSEAEAGCGAGCCSRD
jgi:signal transduction histidine kinase